MLRLVARHTILPRRTSYQAPVVTMKRQLLLCARCLLLLCAWVLSPTLCAERTLVDQQQPDVSAFFSSGYVPPAAQALIQPPPPELAAAPKSLVPHQLVEPATILQATKQQPPSRVVESDSSRRAREFLVEHAGEEVGQDAGGYFVYHKPAAGSKAHGPGGEGPAQSASEGWAHIGPPNLGVDMPPTSGATHHSPTLIYLSVCSGTHGRTLLGGSGKLFMIACSHHSEFYILL